MNRTIARVASAVGAVALAAGFAAPANANPTDQTGAWLSAQLVDGLAPSGYLPGTADYGLSVDVLEALVTLGVEPASVEAIASGLEADPAAYVRGGSATDVWAGSTGKLATGAYLAGRDARGFGGLDLIELIESVTVTEGEETGWAKDRSDWGDYSNGIGQAWVVRALTYADSDLADEAAEFLLRQQCADGGFSGVLSAAGCAADGGTSTADATIFALIALTGAYGFVESDEALDAAINDAAESILAEQAADGSWSTDAGPNSNTTGLAGYVLWLLGYDEEAQAAAEWVAELVVAEADGGALGAEVGAIAHSHDAFAGGLVEGLDNPAVRDQWIRASSQGSLSFVALDDTVTPTPTPTPTSVPTPTPTPTAVPTPSPAEPSVSPSPPTSGPDDGTVTVPVAGKPTAGAGLPATGAELELWQLAAAGALVAAGVGAIAGVRRREKVTE